MITALKGLGLHYSDPSTCPSETLRAHIRTGRGVLIHSLPPTLFPCIPGADMPRGALKCAVFQKYTTALGAPGWLSQLSVRLQLRSWSHSPWAQAPCRALCWHLRAWSLLHILCLPLSLPLPCSCSVSKINNKNMFKKLKRNTPQHCENFSINISKWIENKCPTSSDVCKYPLYVDAFYFPV